MKSGREIMPTKIKAWEVAEGKLLALEDGRYSFTEVELKNGLFDSGDVVGEDLLVLCRQPRCQTAEDWTCSAWIRPADSLFWS
jgi:hypothetical protein